MHTISININVITYVYIQESLWERKSRYITTEEAGAYMAAADCLMMVGWE